MEENKMVNERIRNFIREINEDAILFDNPAFDNSIVGMTEEGAVIYDYDSMAQELAEDDNISIEEAMEFIDYNTIRSIPYAHSLTGSSYAPVIMDSFASEQIEDLKLEVDEVVNDAKRDS